MKTKLKDQSIREEYKMVDAWGLDAGIDLHGCNPATIRDEKKIKRFVVELCEKIEMKRFGECNVVNFGADAKVEGFSMAQFIETSMISAHFANKTNIAYLDIFSCKYYNPYDAADFAKEFFEAKDYDLHYTLRK